MRAESDVDENSGMGAKEWLNSYQTEFIRPHKGVIGDILWSVLPSRAD